MIINTIKEQLHNALKELGVSVSDVVLQPPSHAGHGDYATNIAFIVSKELKKAPLQVAEELAAKIPLKNGVAKVEAVKPGFINFYLSDDAILKHAVNAAQGSFDVPSFHFGSAKKVIVEFAHPNTLKLFHIGHLRNITTGETISRLLEAAGNTVIRANYQGDVGMHIAKTLWKIKQMQENGELKDIEKASVRDKISIIGKAYAAGSTAFETDADAKQEIIHINKQIYSNDPEIMPLWTETRKWSLEYFDGIYTMVGTSFDVFYFESQMANRGVELVKEAVQKGILIEDQGAVIFPGEEYGLDRRVFLNSLGLPTYEGKELALSEKEFTDHGSIDKLIHVLGGEQVSFSKVTFKVQELLSIQKDQQYHLVYGWVDVKGQKMSSRKGNVVEGEWLLNEAKRTILETYEKTDDATAQRLAVAAVKYAFLKNATLTKVDFDLSEAISINGNSGPYLMYTYVRTKSILAKAAAPSELTSVPELNEEELAVLRHLLHYPQVIHMAASTFSPNLLANYLYELSQLFNYFYQQHQIVKAPEAHQQLRLLMTQAVSQTLQHGLALLGIKTVEKM